MLYTEWIPQKQTGSICRQHELPNTTEQNKTQHDTIAHNKRKHCISCCLQVLPEHLKLSLEMRHEPQKIAHDSTAYHTAAQNST